MNTGEEFQTRQFIEEVAGLDLPDPEGVVINHGAALATWGAIEPAEVGDIDAAISRENMLYLRKKIGWSVVRKTVGFRQDGRPIQLIVTQDDEERFDFHRWDFSVSQYKSTGHGRIYVPEMKELSKRDVSTGIHVASSAYVIQKTMQETGRQKDEERLRRIATMRGNQ